ncbi:rhodanese-like domain-containing protein [Gammaproteobacteria bacterium]|nr:rhodanese-like domain-containing protein [Gammaproteobacteria bacterium]
MKKKLITICLYILTAQAFAEVKEVNNQEIMSLMQSGVPIIDIRRAEEWNDTGVIKQSNLLTFFDKQGNHNIDKWLPELRNIAKESDPVIIICRSGKRSGIVSKFLDEQANFTNVYNASGGMLSWVGSKNKTVKPN